MRKQLIAGNWKMHKTTSQAQEFVLQLLAQIPTDLKCEVLICPPFTALSKVAEIIKNSPVKLGAQNMHWEVSGAFTGEVSGEFIKEIGCEYVIIGHSERRTIFGETDEMINKKIKTALQIGLKPIVCVGELLNEREANLTFSVIQRQLDKGLVDINNIEDLVIAYEPVWAIGTGKTATPIQAQEVHQEIRKLIREKYGQTYAEKTRILYGGSVSPDNIKGLMQQSDIDGALVGGASLKIDSFVKLIAWDLT